MGKLIRLPVSGVWPHTEGAAYSGSDPHCLDKQEWSDPEMTGSEVKEPIHLSELQFRPGMCYCLYLTGVNIVSDTFLHNIQPFAFRLLDPGA